MQFYILQTQDIGSGYMKLNHQLENIRFLFYHIWDDLELDYNRDYYESCDWLGYISRQTYGIVSRVGNRYNY